MYEASRCMCILFRATAHRRADAAASAAKRSSVSIDGSISASISVSAPRAPSASYGYARPATGKPSKSALDQILRSPSLFKACFLVKPCVKPCEPPVSRIRHSGESLPTAILHLRHTSYNSKCEYCSCTSQPSAPAHHHKRAKRADRTRLLGSAIGTEGMCREGWLDICGAHL